MVEALIEVLPGGEFDADSEVTEISADLQKLGVVAAYKATNGGCVVTINTSGYSYGLKIMFGVSTDGKITGSKCLASSETMGYEKTYGDSILNADLNSIKGISTVAGATKTTTAYKNAAKAAMQAAVILNGGTVDTRTEEEILNDNLNAALGTTGTQFTVWFKTSDINAISKVYIAEGKGYVFEADGKYASLDSSGTVVKNETSLSADALTAAYNTVKTDAVTDLDYSGVEVSSKVTAVQKSTSGNYIITVNGAGFGIDGPSEWGISSGLPIVIKVCVTPDGTVLACETVSQAETDGIGSVCAEPSYYNRYNGVTGDTIDSVDAISGATYTSTGYKAAVSDAIQLAKILRKAGK